MDKKLQELRDELYECIQNAGHVRAVHLLASAAATLGYRGVIQHVLEPVLVEIGERWLRDELSLAQGYVAGKIAEEVLLRAAQESPIPPGERKGPVVLGNVEDDHHALGRKLVSIFLQSAGWEVVDLGNDVPAEEFVDKAQEVGARIIGVSAMMLTTAEGIARIHELLVQRGLAGRIQLAIGGAVINLRPELVAQFGGDGTCHNAMQAPALFEELWARSLRCGAAGGEAGA
jgi:methanogenic corrinoid protein MtbC1